MNSIWECYSFLHVKPDCSDLEVRKAYRRLAKRIHPDKSMAIIGVEPQFYKLNEAY